MAAKTKPAPKCKQCRKRPRKVRGLCMACYMLIRRAVEAGEMTWKQAIEERLIDPCGKPGPRSKLRKKIASMKCK